MEIAVICSGISGLATALLLGQKHTVHLYDVVESTWGHAHTTSLEKDGKKFNVDSGFLVYNDLTYPHLKGMFKYLDVDTVASDMSLSIQVPDVGPEWAGDNLDTVFVQRRNLVNPRFYKLLLNILDILKKAELNRELARKNKWTIGEMLTKQKYSKELLDWQRNLRTSPAE